MLRNRRVILQHVWSPLDLGGLKLWLDFSDVNTLFTGAGTTNVSADGNAIYQANDKSGNTMNATQATAGNRPLYKTGIKNGLSVASFSGDTSTATGDYFNISLSESSGSYTFVAAYCQLDTIWNASAKQAYLYDAQTGRLVVALARDTNYNSGWYDGSWKDIALPVTGWQTNIWHFVSGGNGTLYRNGASIGTAAYNAVSLGGTQTIGGRYSPSGDQFAYMYLGELLVYNRALASGELTMVETYLNRKWLVY